MGEEIVPLALLREGERGVVVKIEEKIRECLENLGDGKKFGCCSCRANRERFCKTIKKLRNMGLDRGKVIEMLKNQSGQPILVLSENSCLALSRGVAMKIYVKPLE